MDHHRFIPPKVHKAAHEPETERGESIPRHFDWTAAGDHEEIKDKISRDVIDKNFISAVARQRQRA